MSCDVSQIVLPVFLLTMRFVHVLNAGVQALGRAQDLGAGVHGEQASWRHDILLNLLVP